MCTVDRRERLDDAVESLRTAQDGKQAEMWTALPGLVESFDPVAMTVSVQPAVRGRVEDEAGRVSDTTLPLLVDVPVVFPAGGGFVLTCPVKPGDECLVVFASRCIDGWWQAGGIGAVPDARMHDLSDGIAFVGPRSQARRLAPAVDPDNVQLRSDDGEQHLTITPAGDMTLRCTGTLHLDAPQIRVAGNLVWTGQGGSAGAYRMTGTLDLDGALHSTGDQVASGVSQTGHRHRDAGGTGQSGTPVAG